VILAREPKTSSVAGGFVSVLLERKAPGTNAPRLHRLFVAVGAAEALPWCWGKGEGRMGRNGWVSLGMAPGHDSGTLLYLGTGRCSWGLK